MGNFSNRIGELVSKNKLQEALDELKEIFDNSQTLNDIIIQSSNFNAIKREIRNGTISFDVANINLNKIRIAILQLAEEIESISESNPICNEEMKTHLSSKNNIHIQINNGNGDIVGRDKIINNK